MRVAVAAREAKMKKQAAAANEAEIEATTLGKAGEVEICENTAAKQVRGAGGGEKTSAN